MYIKYIMTNFLNLSHSNSLIIQNNRSSLNASQKTSYCYTIPVNSRPKTNGTLNNNYYAVPFKPRPLKQYRTRLFPIDKASTNHISIDTINSPGGAVKCKAFSMDTPKSIILAPYKWHNRL